MKSTYHLQVDKGKLCLEAYSLLLNIESRNCTGIAQFPFVQII